MNVTELPLITSWDGGDLLYTAEDLGGGTFADRKMPKTVMDPFLVRVVGVASSVAGGTNAGAVNDAAGIFNTFFGVNAGLINTSGNRNTFVGFNAGQANTTGVQNSFFGTAAGASNTTGLGNCFFGRNCGSSNTTGTNNIFFGHATGTSNVTGSQNCFFGTIAGNNSTGGNNTMFGFQAGDNLLSGNNNLFIGFDVDAPDNTGSNQLVIGNLIFGTGIDGTGTTISSGNIGIAVVTPTSGLHLGRSFATPYREITATDTFAATDYTINTTSGTFTLNLPTAVGITGRIYVAKNSGAGVVTLDGAGGELIDGLATQAIASGASLTVQSTGAGWIII